jgi:hypothetical protein
MMFHKRAYAQLANSQKQNFDKNFVTSAVAGSSQPEGFPTQAERFYNCGPMHSLPNSKPPQAPLRLTPTRDPAAMTRLGERTA